MLAPCSRLLPRLKVCCISRNIARMHQPTHKPSMHQGAAQAPLGCVHSSLLGHCTTTQSTAHINHLQFSNMRLAALHTRHRCYPLQRLQSCSLCSLLQAVSAACM
jgi:hypothetical protein